MKKTPARWIHEIQLEAVKPLVTAVNGAIKSFAGAEGSAALGRRIELLCAAHLNKLQVAVDREKTKSK